MLLSSRKKEIHLYHSLENFPEIFLKKIIKEIVTAVLQFTPQRKFEQFETQNLDWIMEFSYLYFNSSSSSNPILIYSQKLSFTLQMSNTIFSGSRFHSRPKLRLFVFVYFGNTHAFSVFRLGNSCFARPSNCLHFSVFENKETEKKYSLKISRKLWIVKRLSNRILSNYGEIMHQR